MQNMDDVLSAIDLLEEEGIGVELRVDETNPASIEAALKKLDAEIKAIADKAIEPIKLHLDEDELRAERERLQLELDHLNALEINVKFDLDAAEAARLKAEAECPEDYRRTLEWSECRHEDGSGRGREDQARDRAELLKLEDLNVVRVAASWTRLPSASSRLEMEAVRARIHDLKVKLTREVDKTAARLSAPELLTLARDRIVKLRPVVDNGATRGPPDGPQPPIRSPAGFAMAEGHWGVPEQSGPGSAPHRHVEHGVLWPGGFRHVRIRRSVRVGTAARHHCLWCCTCRTGRSRFP
jgi:hypothetical protein